MLMQGGLHSFREPSFFDLSIVQYVIKQTFQVLYFLSHKYDMALSKLGQGLSMNILYGIFFYVMLSVSFLTQSKDRGGLRQIIVIQRTGNEDSKLFLGVVDGKAWNGPQMTLVMGVDPRFQRSEWS